MTNFNKERTTIFDDSLSVKIVTLGNGNENIRQCVTSFVNDPVPLQENVMWQKDVSKDGLKLFNFLEFRFNQSHLYFAKFRYNLYVWFSKFRNKLSEYGSVSNLLNRFCLVCI